MIIAIPVSEKNLKEDVCVSFGRAPYYYVLDSNKGEGSFLKNPAVDQPGGAGIMSSQILINNKVKVLITKSCGENAANVLRAANVEILKAIKGSLEDNLTAYKTSSLEKLIEIHQGFHGNRS